MGSQALTLSSQGDDGAGKAESGQRCSLLPSKSHTDAQTPCWLKPSSDLAPSGREGALPIITQLLTLQTDSQSQ